MMRVLSWLSILVVGAFGCSDVLEIAVAAAPRQSLFYFQNYRNNQMHYYAQPGDCRWSGSGSRVKPEWVMVTDGNKPQRLGILEGAFKVRTEELLGDGRLKWRIYAFADSKQSSLKDLYFATELTKSGGSCAARTSIQLADWLIELKYIHYGLRGTNLKSAAFVGNHAGKEIVIDWADNNFRKR